MEANSRISDLSRVLRAQEVHGVEDRMNNQVWGRATIGQGGLADG